jgi:hypothetical protein
MKHNNDYVYDRFPTVFSPRASFLLLDFACSDKTEQVTTYSSLV